MVRRDPSPPRIPHPFTHFAVSFLFRAGHESQKKFQKEELVSFKKMTRLLRDTECSTDPLDPVSLHEANEFRETTAKDVSPKENLCVAFENRVRRVSPHVGSQPVTFNGVILIKHYCFLRQYSVLVNITENNRASSLEGCFVYKKNVKSIV